MTLEFREGILLGRHSILPQNHHTLMYSGYFIYKAFVGEWLSDFDEVTAYLISRGSKMS
jgi:hypothetical protein